MKSMQPKIGDTLWGVWEHRYYNEKRLVELEYVVYPVKITRFFKGKYVDAHCVGVDVDGHTAVHWKSSPFHGEGWGFEFPTGPHLLL